MRGVIALTCLAATLCGCATRGERLSWTLDEDRQAGVKLVLGVANSDDLRLLAQCRPHSGEIRLTIYGRRDDPPVVELYSGKLWQRYAGAGVAYDEESLVAQELQFQLHADDPVLMRVADTGELKAKLGDRWLALPNGFAQEHDFLKICRASQP